MVQHSLKYFDIHTHVFLNQCTSLIEKKITQTEKNYPRIYARKL